MVNSKIQHCFTFSKEDNSLDSYFTSTCLLKNNSELFTTSNNKQISLYKINEKEGDIAHVFTVNENDFIYDYDM